MPALSPLGSLLGTLIERNGTVDASPLLHLRETGNATEFDVICAWPVSGQYGPGTRFLYYVLVATCVFGRGSEWLKGACLAAALLLPAVAALHGVVLACIHRDGAVDMDVYGAFQFCAIGVLAGPVTVKISATYFNTPGRNLIFLWTGLVLAGLLSLTVEFFRATPQSCPASEFSWGEDNRCDLVCSEDDGPFSPLRGGSQNNIYVIKTPRYLSFGTATLLSAACCIPAILSLISMWNKILKNNWTKHFGDALGIDALNEPISGTNAATPLKMMKVNDRLRFYLSMVEIPVFGAAILAILIVGERNFFDYRVNYMTEPIASVGQWAPIVGTGFAAMGSLYALLAEGDKENGETDSSQGSHHCHCTHHRDSDDDRSVTTPFRGQNDDDFATAGIESDHNGTAMGRRQTYESTAMPHPTKQLTHTTTKGTADHRERRSTIGSTTSAADAGSRRKVARAFELIGDRLGTPAPDAYDDSDFTIGRAADFPTVPAEEQRNPELQAIMAQYNPPRDSDGNATPNLALRRQRSRAASFAGSTVSGLGIERMAEGEPQRRDTVGGPSRPSIDRVKRRRDTLEVPVPAHLHSPVPRHDSSFGSLTESPRLDEDADYGQASSPTIRISLDPAI